MQSKGHTTLLAVLFAIAVPRVIELVYALGIERNKPQSVRDEFIGENRGVDLNFDQIDGDCGHLCLDYSAYGVGEGEVCLGEREVDARAIGLESIAQRQ